ncbi:MAG: Bug family tripartite tricarboxylate transporter substrate binding protein [Bilophila wadsworthia]
MFASPAATSWLTFAMRNWFTGTGVQVKAGRIQERRRSGRRSRRPCRHDLPLPQNYAPMASADKLKILAIGTKSDVYPNAPTFAEQGYEGNYYGWAGIAAPKGTPKEILDRLAAISEEIVKDPEYIKAIKNMNATPDYSTGEAWMKQLKEQYAEMNKVLTDLGLTGNK